MFSEGIVKSNPERYIYMTLSLAKYEISRLIKFKFVFGN